MIYYFSSFFGLMGSTWLCFRGILHVVTPWSKLVSSECLPGLDVQDGYFTLSGTWTEMTGLKKKDHFSFERNT